MTGQRHKRSSCWNEGGNSTSASYLTRCSILRMRSSSESFFLDALSGDRDCGEDREASLTLCPAGGDDGLLVLAELSGWGFADTESTLTGDTKGSAGGPVSPGMLIGCKLTTTV